MPRIVADTNIYILRAILAVERGEASLEEILRQEVAGCTYPFGHVDAKIPRSVE